METLVRRTGLLGACALVAQAAVEGFLALAAPVLIRGVGPEDVPLSLQQSVERGEEVGAATAALLVLAVLSLAASVRMAHGSTGALVPLGLAHLAAGGGLALFHAPVLGTVLALTGAGWSVVHVCAAPRARGVPARLVPQGRRAR